MADGWLQYAIEVALEYGTPAATVLGVFFFFVLGLVLLMRLLDS